MQLFHRIQSHQPDLSRHNIVMSLLFNTELRNLHLLLFVRLQRVGRHEIHCCGRLRFRSSVISYGLIPQQLSIYPDNIHSLRPRSAVTELPRCDLISVLHQAITI